MIRIETNNSSGSLHSLSSRACKMRECKTSREETKLVTYLEVPPMYECMNDGGRDREEETVCRPISASIGGLYKVSLANP